MSTTIEWTATVNADGTVTPGATWNPVTGCAKISPGCAHCYAENTAERFWHKQYEYVPDGHGGERPRVFTDVQTHADRLDQPLRWKRPRRVFVNSMSDLFHEDVPDEFIDQVFAVMALSPRHTFQILTKRAERMRDYMVALDRALRYPTEPFPRWRSEAEDILTARKDFQTVVTSEWPLPNVWLGVSIENQHFADERIPLLLETPAAVRFISAEPLLGSIDLERGGWSFLEPLRPPPGNKRGHDRGLDWVIVGGESGYEARPFDIAWARSIVKQCQAAGVAVFVKQLGANPTLVTECKFDNVGPERASLRLTNRKGGDMAEWPADLRVRQFPEVSA